MKPAHFSGHQSVCQFYRINEWCAEQECPGCKEELVIQFLVTEGMQRLEDGDAFDLQRELEIRLTEAKRKVKIHMSFLKAGAVLEVITVIFLLGFLGWIIS